MAMKQSHDFDTLRGVYAVFSCIGFELSYDKEKLYTTGAYHGATEAWDAFRKNPSQVFADIERRGNDWHLDIITNAYGSGRYSCWYANRFQSMEQAYRAMLWLASEDWKVLRTKPAESNTGRRLTDNETKELELFILCEGALA